jgi:tetratricopeptide (TPR) repeat protein
LAALDRTDELLRTCAVSDYDVARAQLIRSQIYGDCQRLDEALTLAQVARRVFQRFGDVRRCTITEIAEAAMLMRAGRFPEALAIYTNVLRAERCDEVSRAAALHNAAECCRALSRIDEAKVLFTKAVFEFERLGLVSQRAIARWELARLLFAEQRYTDSLAIGTQLRREFQELGMAHNVALLSVDMAETLVVLDRTAEVVALCREAMEYFRKAGLAYTQGALTALAYITEAAETRTLTQAALGDVRAFFKVLPKQPQLLFAYPA